MNLLATQTLERSIFDKWPLSVSFVRNKHHGRLFIFKIIMDEICRLCCSTKFVNNDIFDEENALYLKMSLYLPIKVFKNDRLPRKVCDKCSCKVNDFYQFCNETIEVQNRLRSLFLSSEACINASIDLTLVKHSASPPPSQPVQCERSTQTDEPGAPPACEVTVQVKHEPDSVSLSPVKKEEDNYYHIDSDHFDDGSSGSDDISLISLKKKKSKGSTLNGVHATDKKARKKAANMKEWGELMESLPDATLTVVESGEPGMPLDSIKEEMLAEKPQDVFHCCTCFTQCYSRAEMVQHYRQHAAQASAEAPPAAPPPPDTDPLRCPRCRKKVSRGEWAAHWARHWERDRRPYSCALCEKTFRDPHQIFKHGTTHKLEAGGAAEPVNKRFVCDLCPEAFVYMRYLQSHRTRAHPEAAGRALALRCGLCARGFAHINSLRRHLRAHSGERNFLCSVCGKALSSREHLKFHARIHTGYKPNVCAVCGKGFVKKCNLTLHERVHSGEKPHVCAHCGKAFSQRSTLVIHERYHSGARPYVCGLCGRGFVAKGLLSMHLKTTCI
nr:zinc finger protein 382 isoform X1 [Helicoverpa armigera]